MNNKPVAWMQVHYKDKMCVTKLSPVQTWEDDIPLYTQPVKEQLNNGHLSDCAIHNEPASRNKPCDCGFEPKYNLSDLKHEDNCRYFDDGEFCTCGAEDSALVEWYRHKEETHPADLTDEEIDNVGDEVSNLIDTYAGRREFARAILRKAQEK